MSDKFKHLLKQQPQKLNETFTVKMANGKTESTREIYIGCTLTLNHHVFQINIIPVSIRSFDVIVGMDWLNPHHAEIMCHEKAVRLHLPNHKTLIYTETNLARTFASSHASRNRSIYERTI